MQKMVVSGQSLRQSFHPSRCSSVKEVCIPSRTISPRVDFVDAVWFPRIAPIAHIVDQEYPHTGERKESFACPFLQQMGWCHNQPYERPAIAVDQHARQRDETSLPHTPPRYWHYALDPTVC